MRGEDSTERVVGGLQAGINYTHICSLSLKKSLDYGRRIGKAFIQSSNVHSTLCQNCQFWLLLQFYFRYR